MIKTDIFVGVCYHKTAPVIATETLRPVQVGAALSKVKLDFAIPDNTGPNISDKNQKWCELTAAYWMRHNVDAEFYGLLHYRRLLSFSSKIKADRSFVWANESDYARFAWDDTVIRNYLSTADIVTPPTYRIHPVGLPDHLLTSYDMYARDHFIEDMDSCLEICRATNPELYPFFLQTLKDTNTRIGNMFIMRRELFFQYTDWIFPILEQTEQRIDSSQYDGYQSRVIGFLAERLTEAYFRYAHAIKSARVIERPVAFAAKPPHPAHVLGELKSAEGLLARKPNSVGNEVEPINIAFAIDEGYAKHAAASLHSVLLHARSPARYRSYVFHKGDLTEASCQKVETVANSFGSKVNFVEIPVDTLRWLPMNRPHISLTTYYRLVMHSFLPEDVRRLIYLDADTLATAALEDLWDTEANGRIIAGAPDEGGVLQSRRLRLSTKHNYFNAGVLILDVDGIRQLDLRGLVLKAFEDNGEFITLQDQDLLNIIFENKAAPLDLRWNVNNRIFLKNELDPAYSDEQSSAAAEHPGIIHFTDKRKPWHLKCYNPYYDLYWFHLNQTPWAETRLESMKRKFKRSLWRRFNASYRKNTADSLSRTETQAI